MSRPVKFPDTLISGQTCQDLYDAIDAKIAEIRELVNKDLLLEPYEIDCETHMITRDLEEIKGRISESYRPKWPNIVPSISLTGDEAQYLESYGIFLGQRGEEREEVGKDRKILYESLQNPNKNTKVPQELAKIIMEYAPSLFIEKEERAEGIGISQNHRYLQKLSEQFQSHTSNRSYYFVSPAIIGCIKSESDRDLGIDAICVMKRYHQEDLEGNPKNLLDLRMHLNDEVLGHGHTKVITAKAIWSERLKNVLRVLNPLPTAIDGSLPLMERVLKSVGRSLLATTALPFVVVAAPVVAVGYAMDYAELGREGVVGTTLTHSEIVNLIVNFGIAREEQEAKEFKKANSAAKAAQNSLSGFDEDELKQAEEESLYEYQLSQAKDLSLEPTQQLPGTNISARSVQLASQEKQNEGVGR